MAHLTSGHATYDKGFEYYTFQVGLEGFSYLSKANDPINSLIAWYMLDPRPAASEVVGIADITPNEAERMVKITLKIKRGHYKFKDFFLEHEHGNIIVEWHEDEIELYCDKCEERESLYIESIPGYAKRATSVTE